MRAQRGFSTIEMVVTAMILLIVAGISIFVLGNSLPAMHTNTGLQATMEVLRQARQTAIDQRRTMVVTFNAPSGSTHSITVQRVVAGTIDPKPLEQIPLPSDVQFAADAKLPQPPNTPDGIGNGTVAIDFEDAVSVTPGAQVYFLPNGSAQSPAGNLENGVVYIERPGYWQFSRAVTVFGGTGKIRSWRLQQVSKGVWKWQ
jgi:Tfp pilus assembly protein FimT